MSKFSPGTVPWNGRDLYLFLAEGKTVLDLRTARDGDNANGVFAAANLADLFATIADAPFAMKSQNFVMYGEEKNEGKPVAIRPELTKPYEKEGKTFQGSFAYTHKQIASFKPVSFIVKTKFIPRKGGGFIPAPLLLCYATAFERTASEGAVGFERKTAAKSEVAETVKRKTVKAD